MQQGVPIYSALIYNAHLFIMHFLFRENGPRISQIADSNSLKWELSYEPLIFEKYWELTDLEKKSAL